MNIYFDKLESNNSKRVNSSLIFIPISNTDGILDVTDASPVLPYPCMNRIITVINLADVYIKLCNTLQFSTIRAYHLSLYFLSTPSFADESCSQGDFVTLSIISTN